MQVIANVGFRAIIRAIFKYFHDRFIIKCRFLQQISCDKLKRSRLSGFNSREQYIDR